MLLKDVFQGTIKYMQILDENGSVDKSLFPEGLTDDKIVEMYKQMFLARAVDAKALSLQRQGRLSTYAPLVGQEAEQIGSAMAMRSNDILVPNFRQHGALLVRGLQLDKFFVYWKGYEDGAVAMKAINSLPVIVPVGTQMPHAAGVAFAQKYKGNDAAVLAYVGDGGTSEGEFYEALNLAGVMKLPLVTVIENNQWAISMPREKQSAATTLAQKAFAAGIAGVQVDGNDVLAVYRATSEAIANAKNGPTLIEAVTYRMSMHTTSDDPTKYRSDSEVEEWKSRDPIARVRRYIDMKALWDESKENEMIEEHSKLIDAAVEKAEQFRPDPKAMFETIYSSMPDVLKEEEDDAIGNGFWLGSI